MSGGNVAYNLRPSKAVERNLFVDLLARIGRHSNISAYAYYSLGGPFLEDFKLVHAALRISNLTCIEENLEVVKRQRFNAPVAGMNFFEGSVNSFLSGFFPEESSVVWFDYASPRQIDQQLTEFSTLLRKLSPGDVCKLTLNANAATLAAKQEGDSPEAAWARQLAVFKARVPRYAPADIVDDDMRAARYPLILLKAIHRAIELARLPSNLVVQPLSSAVYSDTHQMLTFTGIVLDSTEVETFMESTRLRSWPFGVLDWEKEPVRISVPDLSLRERLKLEALMPRTTSEQLKEELGYEIADDQEATKMLLESFVSCYRLLPQYSRVVI